MLTQEILKERLDYSPETGLFTWLLPNSNRIGVGCVAGYESNGYVYISIDTIQYYAHRLAWLYVHGEFPTNEIDHVNGQKSDNRLCNLRPATHGENMKNRTAKPNSLSGVFGVRWNISSKKWTARIKSNRKVIHLGTFSDLKDAILARKAAESRYGFHANHGKLTEGM